MVLGVALLVLAPSAKANPLAPGGTVAPDVCNGCSLGTILAGKYYVPWSYTTTNGVTSGLFEELVITGDASNPYGASDLTFYVAVQDNSSSVDALERVTVSSFTGFSTDVAYDNTTYCGFSPCTAALVDPTSVSRSLNGSVVGFNWPAGAPIGNGDWSSSLLIFTNATTYKPGQVAIIDSGSADLVGYAPSVPEPATLSLLGIGLLGLFGFRKKENA